MSSIAEILDPPLVIYGKEYPYLSARRIPYYSKRYGKLVEVECGMPSDGASGAIDVCPEAWFVHDKLCYTGRFMDGTRCTNWQASMIISDILRDHGRWCRKITWFLATFICGGDECRKNGFFTLKEVNG